MTTNESPRAKSSAISAAIGGLAGGIAVVAAGKLDARSGGDTVAGPASVASFAIDPSAGAPVLETAPAAVVITASLAADTEVPCVQLSRDTEARVADTIREASSVPEGNDASPLPLVVGAAETAGAHVARGLGGGCPVRFDERCALQAR